MPTLSTRLRAIHDELNAITNDLTVLLHDAAHIGLTPFRLASIDHAIVDTEHACHELSDVATSLEPTHATHKP